VSDTAGLVVLFDVDNTLLDNDLVLTRLHREMAGVLPERLADRFWQIYEQVRAETDLVDFPRTVERFGRVCPDATCVGEVAEILYHFPFQECLYPDSLKVIEHTKSFGVPVVLSDGDQFFQRYKIRAAGLEAAVEGRVLIYVHKEDNTGDMQRRYPAAHYALVDDKPRIHVAMKRQMGGKLTTVMVMQGKYAREITDRDRRAVDITIDGIGDMLAMRGGELSTSKAAA
jgi:microcompartment protein CcmK/EutM